MSYLSPLRLHFAGRFQAAPSTVNNDIRNYDNVHFKPEHMPGWNPRGAADWRLIGCRVTAAWHADGRSAGNDDLILTCLVADSDRQVAAKIVDLDPLQQLVSTIWGLEVRICDVNGETLLRGQYETASFIDLWDRATSGGGDIGAGAMYQSILSKLEWGQLDRSPFLMELRRTARDGLLSIKFNVDGYTLDFRSPEFTRGRIVGTIGPATASEPKHLVRGRQFMPVQAQRGVFFTSQGKINFCTAVVDQGAGKIFLDLGNALPTTHPGGPPVNLGELSMVCIQNSMQGLSLGSISYTEDGWYERTAGIVSLPVDRRLTNEEFNALATNPLALLLPGPDNRPTPAISEAPDGRYVRADQFVFHLNAGENAKVRIFATRFGLPYPGAQILLTFDPSHLQRGPGPLEPALPVDAIDYPPGVRADRDGVATVVIRGHNPRNPRGYVDGQVYGVRPVLAEVVVSRSNYPSNPWNFISLLILDDFRADEPPTWWGSLQPIFQQYANLYPVMNSFLNLADYESVCDNLELLRLAFSLKPENPNYMPVTRALSAAKRKAIRRWLKEMGPDGKPLLGTPPPTGVAPTIEPAVTTSQSIEGVLLEDLQGGKASAASRRLVLRPFRGQS
jgi:hypothetical protein